MTWVLGKELVMLGCWPSPVLKLMGWGKGQFCIPQTSSNPAQVGLVSPAVGPSHLQTAPGSYVERGLRGNGLSHQLVLREGNV